MFMRSTPLLHALSASLILAACNDPASAPLVARDPAPALSKAAQPTLLAVTVQDADEIGVAYMIQSDGLGEYVNGVQTMTAEVDASGNLQFGPAFSASLARRIRFNFTAPVDPLNSYRPDESGQQEWKFKTNPNVVPGTPAINALGVNGNPVSGCYGSTVSHQNAGTRYPIIYNTASDPQSVNVYITRTSISPATWTMVTNGPCAGTANRGALYSQTVTNKNAPMVFRGYYQISFSLRLRAL
jgi:hypothetical protein